MCLCAEKPEHKDCECLPKNVQLNPSLKQKCCKQSGNGSPYCDCQNLFDIYGGPTRASYVIEKHRAQYKTCCAKYFKCGFCYDIPTPPPVDKCPEVMQVADKEDKRYKNCCAEHLIFESTKKNPKHNNANTVKCCENFKCTFKSHALCQKPEPKDECSLKEDINNLESPKHDKCCQEQKFSELPQCAKCNSKVFEDVKHKDHKECC